MKIMNPPRTLNAGYSKAISELVQLVKNAGEKVLNGETKLALTSNILRQINVDFHHTLETEFEKSFEVQQNTHFKESFYEDLQCLYDFIQKTVGLKITHGHQTLQGNVNITQFRNLKILEIRKIPIHLVVGLGNICHKLNTIICSRCLPNLKELFESCGGDKTNPDSWNCLTIAILSYNNIEELDESLEFVLNLEVLDLSHNHIEVIRNIHMLRKLTYLNVSYNCLNHLPLIDEDKLPLTLRCLILRNNSLDNLKGLNRLQNLEQLDVGYNCLSHHSELQPLMYLPSLIDIRLDGNPLSYHANHRKFTIQHLHPSVVTTKFKLDCCQLTCSEVMISKKSLFHTDESCAPVYVNPNLRYDFAEPVSCGIISSDAGQRNDRNLLGSAGTSQRKIIKKAKAKEAKIFEGEFPETNVEEEQEQTSVKSGYLEAKDRVEQLRNDCGALWLVESTRMSARSVSPAVSEKFLSSHIENGFLDSSDFVLERSQKDAYESHDASNAVLTTTAQVHNSQLQECDIENNNSEMRVATPPTGTYYDISYESNGTENYNDSTCFSDEENDNESHFVVTLKQNKKEKILMLLVWNTFLREKNINGQSIGRFDLRSLISLELMGNQFGIKLTYDTIRKDFKERIYTMESQADLKAFQELLNPFLEARVLKDIVIGAYQCLNCRAQFSKEVADVIIQSTTKAGCLEEVKVCPNCKSGVIIELDEMPLPGTENVAQNKTSSSISDTSSSQTDTVFKKPNLQEIKHFERRSNKIKDLQKGNRPSKSDPSTPILARKSGSNSFSEMMKNQQQRGLLELSIRNELFKGRTRSANMSMRYLDTGGSMSCGHSPVSGGLFEARSCTSLANVETRTSKENNIGAIANGDNNYDVAYSYRSEDSQNNELTTVDFKNPIVTDEPSTFTPDLVVPRIGFHDSSQLSGCSLKRSESDITILSNPSQISISVTSTPSGDAAGLDSFMESSCKANEYRSSSPLTVQVSYDDDEIAAIAYESRNLINRSLGAIHRNYSNGSIISSISSTSEQNGAEHHRVHSPSSNTSLQSKPPDSFSQSTLRSNDPICSSESLYYSIDNVSPPPLENQNQTSTKSFVSDSLSVSFLNSLEDRTSSNTSLKISHKESLTSSYTSKLFTFSYEDFSQIDHRIHLHLDMNVFSDNESFISILKTCINPLGKLGEFPGLLIMSSTHIYIYKVIGKEVCELKKWMEKIDSHSLSTLKTVYLHLASQAFSLEFRNSNTSATYTFLPRDAYRCSNYFGYLTDYIKRSDGRKQGISAETVEIISLGSDLTNSLQLEIDQFSKQFEPDESTNEFNQYIMGYWINGENEEPVSLVTTPTYIYIIKENVHWHYLKAQGSNGSDDLFEIIQYQNIIDLTQLEVSSDAPNRLKLVFQKEGDVQESTWCVGLETENSFKCFVNALKGPWEKLFGVELHTIDATNL